MPNDYTNKLIQMDPLSEKLNKAGHSGGASKKYTGQKSYKNLMNLKKGVEVIRGTTKIKDLSSSPGNRVNNKFQGRFFFERGKTPKVTKRRELAAKSYAKTRNDPSAKFGLSTVPKNERLILKTTLTPRETAVGRRMFSMLASPKNPYGPKSQRQGRYGRIIVPKSALKRLKVDRKLTRQVRKEKKGGLAK